MNLNSGISLSASIMFAHAAVMGASHQVECPIFTENERERAMVALAKLRDGLDDLRRLQVAISVRCSQLEDVP